MGNRDANPQFELMGCGNVMSRKHPVGRQGFVVIEKEEAPVDPDVPEGDTRVMQITVTVKRDIGLKLRGAADGVIRGLKEQYPGVPLIELLGAKGA